MPQKPNKALRLAVPVVLALVGIGAAVSVLVTSQRPNPRETPPIPEAEVAAGTAGAESDGREAEAVEQDVPAVTDPEPAVVDASSGAESDGDLSAQPEAESTPEPSTQAPVTPGTLRARPVAAAEYSPIGSLDPDGPYSAEVRFTPIGAGVSTYRLAGEFKSVQSRTNERLGEPVEDDEHVEVQSLAALKVRDGTAQTPPFAALWLEVDGPKNRVLLTTAPDGETPVWEERSPGEFVATIVDDADEPVLEVRRKFELDQGSYDLRVEQSVTNLTETPRTVRLVQFGPIDLPPDRLTYGGDKRRFRIGYLLKPSSDPTRGAVVTDGYLKRRESGFVLGKKIDGTDRYPVEKPIWPNPESTRKEHELVWVGTTGRYFGVAVHPDIDPASPPESKAIASVESVSRVMLDTADRLSPIVLRLESPRLELAGSGTENASADLSYRVYAGPLSTAVISEHPSADLSGLEELVVYNFGGPFAFCTFPWLTHLLIGTLRWLHSVFGDYALSIIALVVIVRTVLHPITRWSQVRIQRFGKQMADMAPDQKKIQEKYRDDPKRLQQEMANLWREKGVNPAGALGCAPMFLQSFIWVALYATLFFAYELRHEPAFYGIFQTVTGGEWSFLADMASPDALIRLPESIHFDLPLMGTIRSFNVFPLIYAGVFFFQQKFLTPPTSATLSPEQEAQQKMIRVLLPIIFPIVIYNAPSGLAVYMFFSASLNILENIWIRRDIKRKNLLEVKPKVKKPRRQGGFLERLEKLAEEQKRLQEEKLKQQYKQAGYKSAGGKKESAADRLRRKK